MSFFNSLAKRPLCTKLLCCLFFDVLYTCTLCVVVGSRYHSSNWASGGLMFDEDNDSDTDSKVSGSLAVDKAW